ncbi:MAG TPA: DUF2461 domain-containing protein [Verrucomicrobiae bacterium]|nr:DUF2461 domain-containing protein [Verrucomicrobiae bacterium]
MAFRGWSDEALEFFEGLEADNSKTYWQAHKAVYDDQVRAPMEELLAELEPQFGEGRVFRPYRDVRFSKDKSPYKTNIAATLGEGYISLSADGLGAGCGMYQMAPDQLERFREAIAADKTGAQLEGIVATARKQGMEVTAHDTLKTAPKGYDKDHPRVELLRMKGLITWKQWEPAAWLSTKKAKDRVVTFLEDSKPLMTWLHRHVGGSTMPEHRR